MHILGSGKSLALLCAALAWRENEEKRVTEQLIKGREKALNEKKMETKGVINIEDTQVIAVEETVIKTAIEELPTKDDDFQDEKSSKRQVDDANDPKNWRKRFKCNDESIISVEEDSFEDFQSVTIKKSLVNDENDPPGSHMKVKQEDISNLRYQAFTKVPRIFVGSRTHKQITQLVKELKSKTKYRPRTTILGSRDQLCIHPTVSKSNTKNEDCVELLDKSNCSYAKRAHSILTHRSMKNENRIWDIEDIVKVGKKTRGCPYYASRKIYEGAEVIFCPYNYIIDPIIRKIMDINLKDSIVILDEAHNIEDSSRSAGSLEVDENVLLIISKELDQIIRHGIEADAHGNLQLVVDQLREWIISPDIEYTTIEYENYYSHWTGKELISKLNDVNITAFLFENRMKQAYKTAAGHAEMVRKETEDESLGVPVQQDELSSQVQIHHRKCLSNNSLTTIQGIFMVLGLLFEKKKNYADDYQMVISKQVDRSENSSNSERNRRRRRNEEGPRWSFKLGFKCLNPGVIFKSMTESTRSVILTSGTLSPLSTFASELETEFEGRLEANHVIHKSQVWAGAIPRGPNQVELKGVFTNMESFQYQDDIGEALCQIIESVPFGVLCFLPSYNSMDKFINRWKTTGIHERMLERKMIVCEPRGSDKKEFENAIGSFYTQIDDVELNIDEHGRDGAMFFAVFRGKVSEGIDFTDNYCRAVVTIGIPYPNVRDMEVKFKREYNDWKNTHTANSDVLSGGAWYSAQAFRAINQALGRCIRHKNDWGAIIMLEQRFGTGRVCQGLSKWVRNQLQVYPKFPFAMNSLKEFVQTQQKRTDAPTRGTKLLVNEEANSTEQAVEVSIPNIEAALNSSSAVNLPANIETTSINEQPDNTTGAETFPRPPNLDKEEALLRSTSNAESKKISPFFQPRIPQPNLTLPTAPAISNQINHNSDFDILPNVSNHDTLPFKSPTNTNRNDGIMMPPPVLQSMKIPENIILRKDLLSLHELEKGNTHISCSLCQRPLMHGLVQNLIPVTMSSLRLVSENGDVRNKELVEVCQPFTWTTTEHLVGGPIDTRILPAQIEVILSFADSVCYRFIGCSCSTNNAIGIVICEATNPQGQQYKGRMFIWFNYLKVEREIEQQPQEYVLGDKVDIPSSQAPSMTDLFYSL
ncbi:unnamed protein product [Mucor hiemalis]